MVNLPGYRTEALAGFLAEGPGSQSKPGRMGQYLLHLFEKAADCFWTSPQPGQIIARKGSGRPDLDRCLITGIQTDPESGTSFLVISPDNIPARGYALDRSRERTRWAVKSKYAVTADSPSPTQADELTAFRYTVGAVLNGDGIRAGMSRNGNTETFYIPDMVIVTAAGILPDGREYYVMNTDSDSTRGTSLIAARDTLDSDPGIRRLNAPSGTRRHPAP